MKRLNLQSILLAIFILSFVNVSQAQVVKVKKREFKKAVKQKVKRFKKEDYIPKGAGTIEIYVKEAVNREFETDKEGNAMNDVVYTSAVDVSYEGAVSACRAAARAALAGNIETNVAELVKRSLNTDQISARSANGINNTVIAGKQLIAQKVSIDDIFVFYRQIKDERDGETLFEVEYACYYNKDKALQNAKEYIRKELKEETEELHKDLNKIFKLD